MLFFLTSTVTLSQTGVQNRKFINPNLSERATTTIDFDMTMPKFHNGNLYCVNINQQNITVLGNDGTIKQKIGQRGAGPGEFQSIVGFSVEQSGISVIDGAASIITEFNHKGEVLKMYRHNDLITRAIRLGSTPLYLIKPGNVMQNNQEAFQLVDIDKQTKQSFAATTQLVSQKNSSALALQSILLDGAFIKNGDGKIFRVSQRSGEFLAFDEKAGRVLYGRRTVDATIFDKNLPQSSSSANDVKTININLQGARVVNLSAAANSAYLFILSNAQSPSIKDKAPNITDDRVIDVYNVHNGDYVFSFMMPKFSGKRVVDIAVNADTLYAVYGNDIVQYKFQVP
jgi:outer membrane protein assembly factor BamB